MQLRTCSARALPWLLLFAACSGEGSDIGPSLGPKPPEPFQVQVFDDQTRPVTGALVQSPLATVITGRAGRGETVERPRAATVFTLDARAASARDGDVLAGFAFAAEPIDDARGLGRAIFVPDVATSAGLGLATGVQAVAATLDDSATSGAILTVAAGSVVSDGLAATVTLRTASLLPRHLPVAPPTTPGLATLLTRAVFVSPASVTFGPGAELSVPDEIAATGSAAAVDLVRLDEATGTWVRVGAASAAGGRIVSPAPGIDRGGLYLFHATSARLAQVSGRVIDAKNRAVPGAFVLAGGHATTTDGGGNFTLPPLPVVDLADATRNEAIEVIGGRGYLPVAVATVVTLADGPVPLPDVGLPTATTGHLRILSIERGGTLPDVRVRTSEALRAARADVFLGSAGTGILEDLAAGVYGVTFGRAADEVNAFRTVGLVRIRENERMVDASLFSLRAAYDEDRDGNNVLVTDAEGGGPVQDAVVVSGVIPEQGFAGRTFEAGTVFVGLGHDDQVTASMNSTHAGRRVVGLFTTVQTSANRLELPVRLAVPPRLGAFDRHGLVAGTITGGTAGNTRELRATVPLNYRDWFERVMFDDASGGGRAPVKVAPGVDATATFTAGVPRPRGHVSLAEVRVDLGRTLLDQAFVAFDLAPAEATTEQVTGAFVRADTQFSTVGAPGVDPRIDISTVVADWGVRQAGGTIADVARGTVEIGFPGGGLLFTLPALAGPFANARHLVCLRGAATAAGVTVQQRQVILLTGVSGTPALPMLAVPAITAPLPDAVVSADGFTVDWTVPSDASFVVLRLTSDTGADLREWSALLPAQIRTFSYRKLPVEATPVLVGGRTYQVELTAYRVPASPILAQNEPYRSVISNWVTLGPAEFGVDAIASTMISVSTP